MVAALQGSLLDLDDDDVGPGVLGRTVQRRVLGAGAWVDLRPGWLRGADALFQRLLTGVPWRAERRVMYDRTVAVPRLLCWYGEGAPLPDPALSAARAALDEHYAPMRFCTAGLCLYRDGRDSVAWHGDSVPPELNGETLVAIVSVGAPRALLLRPRGGGPAIRYQLGHGDLLVMGGTCQQTWEHAVPKSARATGPRISVQFRPRGVH